MASQPPLLTLVDTISRYRITCKYNPITGTHKSQN